MIRVYNRLNDSISVIPTEDDEAYRISFERFNADEVKKAAFIAADAIGLAFKDEFVPTIDISINAHTGNWSMTLRNPEDGLRVVITGERDELPLIKEALGI